MDTNELKSKSVDVIGLQVNAKKVKFSDERRETANTFPLVINSFEGNQVISEACNVSRLK
jgi:hypothetical protein